MVNAPFSGVCGFSFGRSKRFCAEDRGFLSEAGQFPFGKPLSGVTRPRLWFCVLVSTVRRFLSVFVLSVLLLEFSFLLSVFRVLCFCVVLRKEPTMGRMYGPGKGMSSATLPYKRRAPSWFKLKPEDLSEQFCKLAMKGITPSSIGVTLRDSFDVAQVEMFTTIKFLRILKKKGLAPSIPEDLFYLVKKGVSTQLSIEEPVEPDCTKYSVSSTSAVFRLGIRELVWSWLDNESRLKIVAIGKDPLLQAGLDFGTSETMYMLSILQSVEVDLQNYESVSWYLPVPSSVSSTSGSSVSSWTP